MGNEVQLCTTCTHRVNELQHDDAAFVLKSEYEDVKNESMEEEYVEVNSLDEIEPNDSLVKKERTARSGKTRNKRRFGYDQMSRF
jgi:hypothetical protein